MLLAGGIALAAWYAGSLRPSGVVTALVVGVLALRVQWSWGVFLIAWFVLASGLSRLGRARKVARTGAVVGKDDRRDAWQVLANGAVFAACAGLSLFVSSPDGSLHTTLALAAAGALTAAGADTWSTEIGTWIGGDPRSLRTLHRVPPGTSGAITMAGSLGGLAGALLLAALAQRLGVIPREAFLPVAAGGVVGATTDTLVGAWWQERRWCESCRASTERAVHSCGTPTVRRGGLRGLGNDAVNAVCTLVGATAAIVLGRIGIGPG